MKRQLLRICELSALFGVDPLKTIRSIKGTAFYFRDVRTWRAQESAGRDEFPMGKYYPCLADRFAEGGSTKGHYFHQDLLVARRIYRNNPHVHVDVGSRIDGFVAHVASFRAVEVLEFRPVTATIPNMRFMQADLMTPIKSSLVDYCDSLSCLHALEHFGLGRYGEPINRDGHRSGLNNLYRILKPGGKFYFSVPIGPQRTEFNAHRVFSVS